MKIYTLIITIIIGSLMQSCTRNFDEINTDPNNANAVEPKQLLAPAMRSAITYNMMRNRNFNNELMQVTVDPSDAEGRVFRYDFRSNWSDYLWNGLFSELTNFKDIYHIAKGDSTNPQKSYMGISLILQSVFYSILTDTYGDIPFSQSNSAKADYGSIKEPAFEAQKDIYLGLFKNLDQANQLLKENQPIDAQADGLYNGDISKWRKFGNALYLRLLLRVSGKSEMAQTAISKIKEIVENESKYPVFTNNDESAILKWTGKGSYVSPYVNGVRAQDFRSPGICSFFIDNLLRWKDPRLDEKKYGVDEINCWGIAKSGGLYVGIPSGYNPGDDISKGSYFYATDQTVAKKSPPANNLQTGSMTGMIMNYAELQFILAEAAAKGWIAGSAEEYYKKGAENSITLWIPQWNEDINTYLEADQIKWNEGDDLEEKMEKIHLLKYYALFLNDMQQWFEHRRTGHPTLPKTSGLKNNGVMPARMEYPIYVQSSNPTNYKAAIARQGSDIISTQVWWQKP